MWTVWHMHALLAVLQQSPRVSDPRFIHSDALFVCDDWPVQIHVCFVGEVEPEYLQ